MSDLVLMGCAEHLARIRTEELIEEYNQPNLTEAGKLEVLQMKMMFMFLEGYNLGQDVKEKEIGERDGNV